jgi:SurA N-terminal domain
VLRTWMKLSAAALVASLAVAACGTVRMGAAAIVGNQRVSSTTLSAEVSNLNAAYQADKKQVQLQFPASEMPQEVLSWLVKFRIGNQLAQREGITVTPTDVAHELNMIATQLRQSGETATLSQVAVANGLPPDQLNALGRYQAIQTKVLDRLDGGKSPSSTAGQQALENKLDRSLCLAAKSLDIQINPQYGALDYSDLSVVAAPTTLSKPQSGSSSSKVELTPSC